MIAPGVYRHFKGGTYRVLFGAQDADDAEECTVYVSMKNGSVWVRRDREFGEPVAWPDGVTRPRFVPIEDAPK